MTYEEARARFESFGAFCDDRNDACDHDCDKCKEMEDYIIEALEKQIPKPKHKYMGYRCVCGEEVAKYQDYCEYCGQRLLEWEDSRE